MRLFEIIIARSMMFWQAASLLYRGSALLARTLELHPLLTAFEKHAELLTAFRTQDCLFVHAGVVGWQGRAVDERRREYPSDFWAGYGPHSGQANRQLGDRVEGRAAYRAASRGAASS